MAGTPHQGQPHRHAASHPAAPPPCPGLPAGSAAPRRASPWASRPPRSAWSAPALALSPGGCPGEGEGGGRVPGGEGSRGRVGMEKTELNRGRGMDVVNGVAVCSAGNPAPRLQRGRAASGDGSNSCGRCSVRCGRSGSSISPRTCPPAWTAAARGCPSPSAPSGGAAPPARPRHATRSARTLPGAAPPGWRTQHLLTTTMTPGAAGLHQAPPPPPPPPLWPHPQLQPPLPALPSPHLRLPLLSVPGWWRCWRATGWRVWGCR